MTNYIEVRRLDDDDQARALRLLRRQGPLPKPQPSRDGLLHCGHPDAPSNIEEFPGDSGVISVCRACSR